jgi:phage repressor protein C with HTH and peptisase S24 domain
MIEREAIKMIKEQPPVLIAADFEFEGMPVVRMRGDSMEDTLRSGDFAVIDTAQTDVSMGGIFALLDERAKLIIMQVTPVHGSRGQRILCTYANARYPPFELEMAGLVKIIGRVAHKVTRYL